MSASITNGNSRVDTRVLDHQVEAAHACAVDFPDTCSAATLLLLHAAE